MNSPLKQSKIKSMITKHMITVMGVLETRVRRKNMFNVWTRLNLHQWSFEHNYLTIEQGTIWVLYDTQYISLTVMEVNLKFIHCKITWDSDEFFWKCVYGSYDPVFRREMWRDLLRIGYNLSEPWLIQGNFYSICSNEDKVGGVPINPGATSDFLNLVEV